MYPRKSRYRWEPKLHSLGAFRRSAHGCLESRARPHASGSVPLQIFAEDYLVQSERKKNFFFCTYEEPGCGRWFCPDIDYQQVTMLDSLKLLLSLRTVGDDAMCNVCSPTTAGMLGCLWQKKRLLGTWNTSGGWGGGGADWQLPKFQSGMLRSFFSTQSRQCLGIRCGGYHFFVFFYRACTIAEVLRTVLTGACIDSGKITVLL